LGEMLGLDLAVLALQPLGVERNESGREGALAEQPAESIGQAEGDEEGIGLPACAHDAAHQHFASKARDPADQRQAADRAGRLDEVHGLRRRANQAWPTGGSPVPPGWSSTCCCASAWAI